MAKVKQRFVVDQEGRKVEVLLDIAEYHELLDAMEQLEAIRAFDAAKASGDDTVPFEEAVAEIEQHQA
ncbi:MAG: hypothetical protein IIA54_03480 [Chloroflexi bacterium]|nr:hypothetical protein [Chloroflexota bacterium]